MRRILRATVFLCVCLLLALALVPQRTLAAPPADSPESYTVQSGDTLFSIATHYNTTVANLKKLNGLTGDVITVGQKLIVPGQAGAPAVAVPVSAATASYMIQAGDTLYRIALRYGTTMAALADLNGIANPNLISPGQAIAIPNNATVAKPGIVIDPPTARQGGTFLVRITRPDLVAATGTFGGDTVPFTRAAGYWYAVVGVSRCAKVGTLPLKLTLSDVNGQSSTESANIAIAATAFPVQTINLPPGKGDLLDATLIRREEEQLAGLVKANTPSRLWSGAFRQPLFGIISSQFGTRRSYNGGAVGACGHEGTDLAVDAGTPIYSDARGRVVFAGLTQVRGNMVVVDHGLGVYSAYYHQSAIEVKVGQMVEAGDLIGKVGTTGLSTGNHLHWSLFVHGEYVDPMEWTRRMMP